MYNTNELLARIQAGENPEDIANEFAKQLNDVIELDRKQKEAEAAAKAKEEAASKREAELNNYASQMADAIMGYVRVSDPEIADLLDEDGALDIAEIRRLIDASLKTVALTLKFTNAFKDEETDSKASLSPDDSIKQFLNAFGL